MILSFLTGNKKQEKKYFFVFTEEIENKKVKGVVLGITYGPIPNKKDIELLPEFYNKTITNIFKIDELKFNSLKEKGYSVITM